MFASEPIRLLAPHLAWRTYTLKPEERLRGWVAGPLVVVSCHFSNSASRPCRHIITKGECPCYCQDKPTSTRQLGYLPVITPGRERVVVLMCASTAKKAHLLARTEPVEFVRPKRQKVGLYFNRLNPAELGNGPVVQQLRREEHDVREYLWRVLWQDPVLVAYFEQRMAAEKAAATIARASSADPADSIGKLPKMPPLVRRPRARDNEQSETKGEEGTGKTPDAA